MKNNILLSLGFLLFAGCIPVLIGAGVVTGYTLSSDAAYGNIKSEYRIIWDICLDKLETMEAEILHINESKGVIKARISENSVVIKINSVGLETQHLKVTARRLLMPRPQFAQKVFLKIIEDL